MIEVRTRYVSVVGNQDIARLEVVEAEVLNARLHCFRHASDEHRKTETDGHSAPVSCVDSHGEIERFVNNWVVSSTRKVGLHLLGNGNNTVAHDFGYDRVNTGLSYL